jgi:Mn-dependent transcriptional regulator
MKTYTLLPFIVRVGVFMNENKFFTFSEYMKKEDNVLTASMEDYMEMIYRLSMKSHFTRVNELSEALNVQPPSVTKMIQKLSKLKLLKYEKYGVIILEDKGIKIARKLIDRHNTIAKILKILGVDKNNILEETEKMEHTIDEQTIQCFNNFINFVDDNPDIYLKFKDQISKNK